jgi:Alw26I/Eco31I/Esp3I family type II restriction endonuclease
MPLRPTQIDDDPNSYGSKGQSWNATFVQYMKSIVMHPNYAGMPDALKDDGKIQWEAPSNRSGGQYKDTHHRRRDWWRAKATEIGIDVREDKWISRTAKKIHPTGEKPCKRCGRVLRIAYVYPGASLVNRCAKEFGDDLAPEPLEAIGDYVRRLVDSPGPAALRKLQKLLKTEASTPPNLGEALDAWLKWIEDDYVPLEPSLLSPGAMSNAPDRFDGFHSFNRCCRGEADTGRHAQNMKSYTTDRRVFEYWSEGNWIAADRMMGVVRARFHNHPSADGGDGPPTADHIGPLSLGFTHRPEFRLLSKSANSAKNNRMSLWDVDYLRRREDGGASVASWYARPIWRVLRDLVVDEETALRLSKVMRDNQRQAISFLADIRNCGHAAFLASLLELEYADVDVDFEDLVIEDFVTKYGHMVCRDRTTKYATEQKARRLRIGFEALRSYTAKSNRHFIPIRTRAVERALGLAKKTLALADRDIHALNQEIIALLDQPSTSIHEEELRRRSARVPRIEDVEAFAVARQHLEVAMTEVAAELAAKWNDERYIRAEFAFDED